LLAEECVVSIAVSRISIVLALGVTVSLQLACSSEAPADSAAPINKSLLVSYAARWDGYVEAFTFRSGTDRVRVALAAAGDGLLQAGDGDLLPPPTDPDVGYPPALLDDTLAAFTLSLYDRVSYPIVGARVESERIRFEIDGMATYAQWCALQTPVQRYNVDGYGCTAEASIGNANPDGSCTTHESAGGPAVPIDCGKLILCNGGCRCDAASCTTEPGPLYRIDAALDDTGDHLDGTIVVPTWTDQGTPYRIRLTRTP
jgi:hypothetical protein